MSDLDQYFQNRRLLIFVKIEKLQQMGAECCSATSNQKNNQIIAEKTQQQYEDQPNQQMLKQLQQKQQQENQLKKIFYGTPGVSCSKTMTAQKYGKIEILANDCKDNILKKSNKIEKIKQEEQQDQVSKEPQKIIQKNKISTIQVIQQEANLYLDQMFEKQNNETKQNSQLKLTKKSKYR